MYQAHLALHGTLSLGKSKTLKSSTGQANGLVGFLTLYVIQTTAADKKTTTINHYLNYKALRDRSRRGDYV
jgi:hypothetical protein